MPTTKSFFVASELYPPDGDNPPIQLGQLITDLDDPGMKLADKKPLGIAKYGMTVSSMPVSVVKKFNESSTSSHVETRIFFKALEYFIVGLRMKYDQTNFESQLHNIDTLRTNTIFPTDEYVKDSLLRVEDHLRKGLFRQTVYMVTAIKIAQKGARMAVQSGDTRGRAAEGQTQAGAVEIGCGASAQLESKIYRLHGTSFVAEADFVYAFQVRKCHFGSRSVEKSLYTKNALLTGAHVEEGGADLESEEVLELDYYGFADTDATAKDLGQKRAMYDTFSLVDEETREACSCISLKRP